MGFGESQNCQTAGESLSSQIGACVKVVVIRAYVKNVPLVKLYLEDISSKGMGLLSLDPEDVGYFVNPFSLPGSEDNVRKDTFKHF